VISKIDTNISTSACCSNILQALICIVMFLSREQLKEYIEEDMQPRRAVSIQVEGSFHRYVQWHMEHPVDDLCTSKHQCIEEPEDSVLTCAGLNAEDGELSCVPEAMLTQYSFRIPRHFSLPVI
jgi:hypothetical protein